MGQFFNSMSLEQANELCYLFWLNGKAEGAGKVLRTKNATRKQAEEAISLLKEGKAGEADDLMLSTLTKVKRYG